MAFLDWQPALMISGIRATTSTPTARCTSTSTAIKCGMGGISLVDSDKSNWSAPMWQAHISRMATYEERKHAVDTEVPEHMKERVIGHLKTVRAVKNRAGARR